MDVAMSFCPGKYKVEYYEMGSETVTRTRIVTFDYDLENDFIEISNSKLEKVLNNSTGGCGNDKVDGYFRKSSALNLEILIIGTSWNVNLEDIQITDFSGLEIFTNLFSDIIACVKNVEIAPELIILSSEIYFDEKTIYFYWHKARSFRGI